jgi:hypothetical protein
MAALLALYGLRWFLVITCQKDALGESLPPGSRAAFSSTRTNEYYTPWLALAKYRNGHFQSTNKREKIDIKVPFPRVHVDVGRTNASQGIQSASIQD